ncbi:MAG: carboxylating nicotinate-nucleotide diphosphorylase [Thermogutta sp.]|nr:carboxylating nicotinate-nucleotide diphosphorylase [Thermogutta sp.]
MGRDFRQITWGSELGKIVRDLATSAKVEDLPPGGDVTSVALISPQAEGTARMVLREEAVASGLEAAPIWLAAYSEQLRWRAAVRDAEKLPAGSALGELSGPVVHILQAERTLLNFLSHLFGIATMTARFVAAVAGTSARIYDTRKTTPGWRLLEKYAVRCGGGYNHRLNLSDAVLIKDNHIAWLAESLGLSPSAAAKEAVARVKARYAAQTSAEARPPSQALPLIEVEVDTLEQLQAVLPERPDIVLLDNMTPEELARAVRFRDAAAPGVELEASGGVRLANVRSIAETGVDRISVGALTQGVPAVDIGLDWG